MKKKSLHLRKITISAVFLSIALVLKTVFSFHIPMFGQNGMRIGIAGIFSIMPSILFGPVYGAVTSGLSDLLGYFLKPTGPFLPMMTLAVASGGFVRGLIWQSIHKKNSKKMRIIVAAISFALLIFGLLNMWFLAADGINSTFYSTVTPETVDTDDMHLISKMLISRTADTKDPAGNLSTYIIFMTAGLIGSAVFGIILLSAELIMSKKFALNEHSVKIMPLLISMVSAGLMVTTINTVIMREMVFPSWKLLPFSVVWLPRVIEEIFGNTLKAYFVAMLLSVFKKQSSLKDLINF